MISCEIRSYDVLYGILFLLVALSLYIHDPAQSAWYLWLTAAILQFLFACFPPSSTVRFGWWLVWFVVVIVLLWRM
jgi:hypothetical protein